MLAVLRDGDNKPFAIRPQMVAMVQPNGTLANHSNIIVGGNALSVRGAVGTITQALNDAERNIEPSKNAKANANSGVIATIGGDDEA